MLDATRQSQEHRRSRAQRREHTIMGVPARFMRPRIIVILVSAILAVFGLIMVYSSSSIVAQSSATYNNDPAFFFMSQLRNLIIGVVFAVIIVSFDYHRFTQSPTILIAIWLVLTISLILVHTPLAGADAYGATRWLSIGGFTLQPSEFAKPLLIVITSRIFQQFFEERSITQREFILYISLGLLLPLVLVLAQPDKGTVLIISLTVVCMLYMAGAPKPMVLAVLGIGILIFIFLMFRDAYSTARFETMQNPWEDAQGSGYQLIQGFYAFGSGGFLGTGIGSSHEKYGYLPMSYNDFIFAIVGEECGFIGCVLVLAAFAVLIWQGYKIAQYAPDASGRLIAVGASSILGIQLLVNVMGVLGLIPLSGKPVPFLSYGGSSIISTCMLIGLILSVSRSSILPLTSHDQARSRIRVASDEAYITPPTSQTSGFTVLPDRGYDRYQQGAHDEAYARLRSSGTRLSYADTSRDYVHSTTRKTRRGTRSGAKPRTRRN